MNHEDSERIDTDVEPQTCADSVGPRTFEEAQRRGLEGEPFNFRPEDFERIDASDDEDGGE